MVCILGGFGGQGSHHGAHAEVTCGGLSMIESITASSPNGSSSGTRFESLAIWQFCKNNWAPDESWTSSGNSWCTWYSPRKNRYCYSLLRKEGMKQICCTNMLWHRVPSPPIAYLYGMHWSSSPCSGGGVEVPLGYLMPYMLQVQLAVCKKKKVLSLGTKLHFTIVPIWVL